MQKPGKPEKPILPTRNPPPGRFFGLSVHRAGLDQPWLMSFFFSTMAPFGSSGQTTN